MLPAQGLGGACRGKPFLEIGCPSAKCCDLAFEALPIELDLGERALEHRDLIRSANASGGEFAFNLCALCSSFREQILEPSHLAPQIASTNRERTLNLYEQTGKVVGGRKNRHSASRRRRRAGTAGRCGEHVGHAAFEVEICVVGKRNLDGRRLADQAGISEHDATKFVRTGGAYQAGKRCACLPVACRLGEYFEQSSADRHHEISRRVRSARGIRVDRLLGNVDGQVKAVRRERRHRLVEDVADKKDEERKRKQDRGHAIGAEPSFRPVTPFNAATGDRARHIDRAGAARNGHVSHTALGTGARREAR